MKKFLALLAALLLVVSCAGVAMAEDEITLDVIICQYGNNTENWFLGTGMNGTSFVKKFEAENPGIKLNLEVVSWDDVRSEVSTRITNNKQPDILNIKCDPVMAGSFRGKPGFFPAYHMNKDRWITILLDGSAAREDITGLLAMSYELSKRKKTATIRPAIDW